MLILNRKAEEEIDIGSDITIRILETHSGSVKIGIKAPRDGVRVIRGELRTAADYSHRKDKREQSLAEAAMAIALAAAEAEAAAKEAAEWAEAEENDEWLRWHEAGKEVANA